MPDPHLAPPLGVVIVSFNSSDVLFDCLESLLATRDVTLHIVVVDNASDDGTPDLLADWAAGRVSYTAPDDLPFALSACAKPVAVAQGRAGMAAAPGLTLVRAPANLGFAGGVNLGLTCLAATPGIDRFWVLNPDGVAAPGTPGAFARATPPGGRFSLMGGRVTYLDPPDQIQIDGGTLNRRTGVTGNLNLGRDIRHTPPPETTAMDFITGASMVASRAFYDAVGPMREDYFLYYEEVDWAMRRGDLPLAHCAQARVYHRAGTAIGSPTLGRIASPFSLYFKHRGRMRFLRRFHPSNMAWAWAWSLAKAAQMAIRGHRAEAAALLAGCRDAPPPPDVRARLTPETAALAFTPPERD